MLALLLKAGADPKIATRLGATPLYLASVNGNPATIRRLLGAGADPNAPVLQHGETALMFAAQSGNVESVKLLLYAGAKTETQDTLRGTTALSWAAQENHAAPLGPAPATANGTGGVTALMLAVREDALESVQALIAGGAPIDQSSANGTAALMVAFQNENVRLARLLIKHGADVKLENGKGWTPLFLAVKGRTLGQGTTPNPTIDTAGLMELIKVMIEKGADVNARTRGASENSQRGSSHVVE